MNSNIKGGLSWIELLVLIAVLGFLAAVLIPTSTHCGGRVRYTLDASNIRQIGHAALIYANDNDEQLPGLNLTTTGEIDL